MRVALVTNCTNRKALPPARARTAAAMRARTLPTFLRVWRERIAAAAQRMPAKDLYLGRGFSEALLARDAARELGSCTLYIASAGVGLVSDAQPVPSYSITVARRGEDSVLNLLGLSDAAEWWDALTAGRQSLIARCAKADLIVAALSGPYLHMMRHELIAIAEAEPERLRLICRADPALLDPVLRKVWLPYDNRLNSKRSPIVGAESDFAQRALHHFASAVLPTTPKADRYRHAARVRAALAPLSPPRRRERQRLSDTQLKALMRRIGPDVGAGRMLRVLRDDQKVACEQGRCSALYRQVFPKARSGRVAA